MSEMKDIEKAFPDAESTEFAGMKQMISEIMKVSPQSRQVFSQISSYVLALRTGKHDPAAPDEPLQKRRKLANGAIYGSSASLQEVILIVPQVSFSLPQRKKFTLRLTRSNLEAVGNSGQPDFSVALNDIVFIACLPVPDRAARQWNFCVFPKDSEGLGPKANDTLVWSVNEGLPNGMSGVALEGHTLETDFKALLTKILNDNIIKVEVVEPDPEVFRSTFVQPHRKGDISFHVKAHRGTKEGYLFFLGDAIIWAFKKPMYCFFFDMIDSLSYSNITQRTFNLNIQTSAAQGGAEIEFAMIDQAEYAHIDAYIKNNSLNDASMAEERKARRANINGKGRGESEDDPENENIKNALLELDALDANEDEEDDEDYQTGSDSDSGSRSSNDSDDDDEDDEDDEDPKGSGSEQDESGGNGEGQNEE